MPYQNLTSAGQAEFLHLLLDSTLEGFYSVDTEGVTTMCNKAFLNMLGYASVDEVIGRKLHGEIHHHHPDGTHYDVKDCPIYQAAKGGAGLFVAYEVFFRKDGTSFPVEYRAEPIVKDGKPHGAICTFLDITEKRRVALALEETRSNYENLFNSIDQGFCIIEVLFNAQGKGFNYRFVQVNPAFELQTGLKDAVGKTMLDIAPDHEHRWGEVYGEVDKTSKPIRFNNYAEALNRWFDVYAFKPKNAPPAHIAVLFSDITQRKAAEQKVEESQAHLSLMVESAQDYAIISTGKTGKVISWNNGAERVFGYLPHEVIGKPISFIFTPEDREAHVPEHELEVATRDGRASDERWHLRKTGERFYVSGIMAAMHDAEGQVNGFIKIARDMTKEQHAQEALVEARNASEAANIAKTEFLANMSHEIRTPMNAIIGLSNILAMSQPLTPKQKEFVKTLQMSADSLLGLINDLLDISKIEARSVDLEHIPFSVTQLIQEVVSMMAVRVKEKGLAFTGDGECVHNRMFMGDPTRLRQIVLNLCSNAIKFTENGGVHVAITCEPHAEAGKETVCIAVTDTGIGIAPDKLQDIFHKFVQADTSINRKYGGTGLGLAITKTLSEIMGGTLTVTSKNGEGSTFKVCVPLEIATDQEIVATNLSLASVVETSVQSKVRPRVLLVEDYAPNVMVATTFLEQFGYAVDSAENGLEGFERAKSGQYIAVLMDVQMHGMNGFEATKLIREHEKKNGLPRLMIIGMTAHALAGDRERCIAAGMDDYIAKPFNPQELQAKLLTVAN